jgi:hypothetical protein
MARRGWAYQHRTAELSVGTVDRARKFREKAQEHRAMAALMSNEVARASFLSLALSYEDLAQVAEMLARQTGARGGDEGKSR